MTITFAVSKFFLQISSKCRIRNLDKETSNKRPHLEGNLHKDLKLNFSNIFPMIEVHYFSQTVCIHTTSL